MNSERQSFMLREGDAIVNLCNVQVAVVQDGLEQLYEDVYAKKTMVLVLYILLKAKHLQLVL